jgi:hypothetical protein
VQQLKVVRPGTASRRHAALLEGLDVRRCHRPSRHAGSKGPTAAAQQNTSNQARDQRTPSPSSCRLLFVPIADALLRGATNLVALLTVVMRTMMLLSRMHLRFMHPFVQNSLSIPSLLSFRGLRPSSSFPRGGLLLQLLFLIARRSYCTVSPIEDDILYILYLN